MISATIRSRVPKITFRRPPQFPEAAAQLMENGDLRIKFSRSLIVRKVENGEIFNCIDGMMSKKEGVHGQNLTKVNEVFEYLKRFEACLMSGGMGNLQCFPIVFSAGANVNIASNNSPFSIMPSTSSTTRFAFSNINSQQNQIPRSAPFQVNRQQQQSESTYSNIKTRISEQPFHQKGNDFPQNDENSRQIPKFKFKMDKNNRTIAIHAKDGRLLRQSTRDLAQFIFTDPSIRPDEVRFRRGTDRPPERAAELLHYLLPKLSAN
ncbi:unnamed protein product [Caenorhabditis angaria]|uniref:Zyg-1 polo box domain-containing protein n=1 Tax=Caenorhabditis angaria TaxID=860376 RepID=A0A9P1MVT3_9PELO|nr:unnamed protein product [Caenorhabditis angaria]